MLVVRPSLTHNASSVRYIRIKRQNQTFCFHCSPSETVQDLKEKVVVAANQHCGGDEANKISASLLQICQSTEGFSSKLDDSTGVADLPDVLYVVLKVSDDEWEPVDVESTDLEQDTSTS